MNQLFDRGSSHFETEPEKRVNRLSNQLLLLSLFCVLFSAIGHVGLLILNQSGYLGTSTFSTILAYAIACHLLLVFILVVCYLLKAVSKHIIRYSGLALVAGVACVACLAILYGKTAGLHFALLITLSFPCMFYHYFSKPLVIAGILINLFALFSLSALLSPGPFIEGSVPAWFSNGLFYGTLAAVAVFLNLCLYYLVQGSHNAESKLKNEKNRADQLLNEVIPEIEFTTMKYEYLVDHSNDIVFNLDEDFCFSHMNQAVQKFLRYSPESLVGTRFIELVYAETKNSLTQTLVDERLKALSAEFPHATFHIPLRMKNGLEPVEMRVTLLRTEADGRVTYLGKAGTVDEDRILDFLQLERHRYRVDNYLQNADLLSENLVENLSKRFTQRDIAAMRMGLREIILNAIEHGNLAMTFEEKSEAQLNGTYLDLLKSRQRDEKFRHKQVTVDYMFTPDMVIYMITDEGNGFNFENLEEKTSTIDEDGLAHGRGVRMTRASFDKVQYTEGGRRVSLVKFIPGSIFQVKLQNELQR